LVDRLEKTTTKKQQKKTLNKVSGCKNGCFYGHSNQNDQAN
jgi:hypothetical protein